MRASLVQTIIPLSLLGTAIAGVIQVPRGEGNDTKKYEEDPKEHVDNHDHDYDNAVSPEFIGCVSRTFFNLVSHDEGFDGDFSEQANLQECIDHCVDEAFRYTYWDADRKQCYCSPAQRPAADQIRDNDEDTGRCKPRDAIVFLNNAQFKFGGCFGPFDAVAPVAQSAATSVRECFTFCDEPCRDDFIEVVGITPRFDNALYSFNYLCQCFDVKSYNDYTALVNRTCAIDSIFGYARAEQHSDDDGKKHEVAKRYEYDDEYDYDPDHKKHDDHEWEHKGEDHDYDNKKEYEDEEDDYDYDEKKDHEHDDDDDEDYDEHHKNDNDDSKKHDDDEHKKDGDDDNDEDDYKKHGDDNDDDWKKHANEDHYDEEDYDHDYKKHDDDDEEYNYKDHDDDYKGKYHGDDDDKDEDYKKHHDYYEDEDAYDDGYKGKYDDK